MELTVGTIITGKVTSITKFGAFVAVLRKEKGITQKELSEQLCISDKAVSKWETGVSHS